MLKKLSPILMMSVSLCLSACGSKSELAPPPMAVETVTVRLNHWQAHLQTTATVMALRGAVLKAEVPGRVTKVAFKPGDTVAVGALLYDINPLHLAAQLRMSQAEAELDAANYQRAMSLYAQHVIAKADFDQARSTAKTALAKVEAAQAELAQVSIHAPFTGKVGLDLVQEGDYVTAGQSLVSLQQLDRLRIDFSVPEQYSAWLQTSDPVLVKAGDSGTATYAGRVTAIDNAIDSQTRLLAVRATIDNPQHSLLPGTFVNATLYYGPLLNVIMIPQTAVLNSDQGTIVYRVVAGKALMTPVKQGVRLGDRVIIDQGLKVNDVVMTAGQMKAQPGMPVRVVPAHG